MSGWIDWVDAFAAGVYLLFGAVHFDLWLRRRQRRGHLWLAGAALGALAVDLTGILGRRTVGYPPGALPALNLGGAAFASGCLNELVSALAARPTGGALRAVWGAALAAAVLGGAARWPQAQPVVLALCMALLLAAMARGFVAARRGGREVAVVASGLVVLTATLVLDILGEMSVLPARPGLPVLGFVVLFLASAKSLADRADREEAELVALRLDLERRVAERTEELRRANRALVEASRTDALTGLPNRRGLFERADTILPAQRRAGSPVAVLLADVDHFKRINDTRGHAVGDAVLRELAAAVRGALRAEDVVARWGGEELLVLLPGADRAGGAQAAEAVRAAVARRGFAAEGWPEPVTLSVGVAEHAPGGSLDATIGAADAALYCAKAAGRDRVEVAGPQS